MTLTRLLVAHRGEVAAGPGHAADRGLEPVAVAPADDRTCGHVDAAGTVRGKGLSVADVFEVDDVIDPAATRDVVLAALETAGGELRPRHPLVDTW